MWDTKWEIVPATDDDRAVWLLCAADERHTALDVQYIVQAYEAKVRDLEAELSQRDEWQQTSDAYQRAERAEAALAKLTAAIQEHAWNPGGGCYHCGNYRSWGKGHKDDCILLSVVSR